MCLCVGICMPCTWVCFHNCCTYDIFILCLAQYLFIGLLSVTVWLISLPVFSSNNLKSALSVVSIHTLQGTTEWLICVLHNADVPNSYSNRSAPSGAPVYFEWHTCMHCCIRWCRSNWVHLSHLAPLKHGCRLVEQLYAGPDIITYIFPSVLTLGANRKL